MKGLVCKIKDLTKENADFRRVLCTAKQIQLVLIVPPPGEQIREEVQRRRAQFSVSRRKGAKSASTASQRRLSAT